MRSFLIIILHLVIFSASAQNKWTAIMSEGDMAQAYNSFYTLDAVEKFIRNQAAENKVINELEYGDGKWHVVATYSKEVTTIVWKWDAEFPAAWIKQEWGDGKYIKNLAWGDGKWAVVMTSKLPYKDQKWATRNSWDDLETWISESWKENTSYTITDLAYANGKWCGVLSVLENYEPQSYKVSEEFPSKWIQSKYDEKYNLSTVENDGKKWYVVMTKKASQLSETILNPQVGFPEAKIKEQWDKKRRISGLVYINSTANPSLRDEELLAGLGDFLNDDVYEDMKKSGDNKLAAKDYAGAIADYESAIKIKATEEGIWNNLAWARYLAGYCYSSLNDVNKSIAIKSTAYNNHTKAAILKCQGKCTEALSFFNEAIRLYRVEYGKLTNADYYTDRADAKKCSGNYSGAIDDMELALTLEPGNAAFQKKLKELADLAATK